MAISLAKELRRSKYRLLGLVGQGQFGRVYCASYRRTGRLVALKELNRDRFSTHKFLRELRFLLSLQHRNIVICHAMEQTTNGRYLVMDYCDGGTMRSLLENDVRLNPVQGLKLIMHVLAGLDHAHQKGIVHCDIKPENILLAADANGWIARISDFGIARLSQEMKSDDFSNTGSPAYMAPERFYGQYFPSSDLYSVGILLFEVLVGDRPFSGPPAELMSAHLNQAVKIPDSVPDALKTVILKSLQKLPARRFHSAQEMLEALQEAAPEVEERLIQEWGASKLLTSYQPLPACEFRSEYEETLQSSIQKLVSGSLLPGLSTSKTTLSSQQQLSSNQTRPLEPHFFRVFGNQVQCHFYPEVIESSTKQMTQDSTSAVKNSLPIKTVRLPDPIVDLKAFSSGAFAVTSKAVYLLPASLLQLHSSSLQENLQPLPDDSIEQGIPQLLTEFNGNVMADIAHEGRWMVTATSLPDESQSNINVWNLRKLQPFKPARSFQSASCFKVLAIDAFHIATFSNLVDQASNACITGVLIEIFTRRGNPLGSLKLPVPLKQIKSSLTPYRLIAMEPNYPNSMLLLDLKPLRVRRIGLNIQPHLITATPWGYGLIDVKGHLVLLDQYGQWIGQVDAPANPTALACLDTHRLLITTWDGKQGKLYIANLQDLEVDFLF